MIGLQKQIRIYENKLTDQKKKKKKDKPSH